MRRKCIGFFVLFSLMMLGFSSAVISQFGNPVPRYPQEMDGPVNMVNRALVFSETDLAVPGRGLGIEFTRYYNSDGKSPSARRASYMGYRWSHSYRWYIESRGTRNKWIFRDGWASPNPDPFTVTVVTDTGSQQGFTTSGSDLNKSGWESRIKFHPKTGVRAALKLVQSGTKWAYVYTTRGGISYRFERPVNIATRYVLTKISDPNGNRIKLHYEATPETSTYSYPRLVAVEDSLGRILKFYYAVRIDDVAYPRFVSKIEFGLGTPQALTTVYQTVNYSYSRYRYIRWRNGGWEYTPYISCLTSAAHQLGSGDPRGASLTTQYQYNRSSLYEGRLFGYLSAIVSPLGYRTEFLISNGKVSYVRFRDVPRGGNANGAVLYERGYVYGVVCKEPVTKTKRYQYGYRVSSGLVIDINHGFGLPDWGNHYLSRWSYSNGNVIRATYLDRTDIKKSVSPSRFRRKFYYKIYYAGANAKHNRRMGNPTKWEQYSSDYRVYDEVGSRPSRTWQADYETTFNRPIWQIDAMGHKTTFTYDTKGNLTEQRSKASTGSQPHAVDHDIVTAHEYDSYGNRVKTKFMPGTTQEKVVTTVYDSTHHTYPIEVKTTVTVDGAARTIKTKSEWDANRGLKTADIDAQGRRTEYAYWKDRKLKYTKRVADNLYTVPTYDKNGNVTQTQVRKTNWQTGALIAQTKTEYDAMNRAVKAHSFKDNWTTPYATTETVYDFFGDVSQTKDPRGLITNYTRDQFGNVTKQTLPDGDWVETRYNSLDQVTKAWTSQNGSESSPAVSHTYDNFNRLSKVSYKTGEVVDYTYDLGDNTLTQKTNDGTNTYTYTYTHDQLNRVMTRNDSPLGYKTFYEYDDASMRTRMYIQPSAGGTKLYDVNYTYDKANRLLSVKDALASKTASYSYFDIGAIKKVTNPNGITAHRTLDTLNRLDTLQYKTNATTVLSSLDYTYDDKSNVTKLIRNDTGAGGTSKTFTFGYDKLSRLTSANYGNETVSYTYDKSGNRLTQVSSVDGTTTYTIAANSNQLNSRSLVPEDSDFATMSYTYDKEGNLTKRSEGNDSDAFTYGFGSQLKQIQKTRNNAVTQTLKYSYDGGGQRVKVTDSTDSGATRYFLYDGMMPVLELDSSKNVVASYLYGADGAVYRRKHIAAAYWHFDEGTGTVAHDVDGRNNGTLGGGTATKTPSWSTDGGSSLLFDGTNDLVKVPDSDALDLVGNTLTLSCWVKRSAASSGNLVKKADASNGYRLWITSTGAVQFEILIAGTTKTVTSTTTIPLNAWRHVAARYNGSELRVFIGGTIEAATTAATGSLVATTEALWLGYYDGTSHHLNGYLDDVSIYDTALSDSEITNLSNNRPGRYEYHHANALGSNIVLTDDRKNVIVRYEYDVFGAIRSQVGTSDNVRTFTGKEYESDVKLCHFPGRSGGYDPYIGRFNQRDPAKDGLNWYIYTENNPLKYIDPTGQILFTASVASGTGYFDRATVFYADGGFYVNGGDNGVWDFITLEKATSLMLDYVPFIGDAKGFLEGVIGQDLLTGDSYSPVDRFLGLILLSEVRGAKKGLDALGAAIDAAGGLSKIGRKGKGRGVREVVGGESDARDLFDVLRGDNPIIDVHDKKTGAKIGIRAKSKDVPGRWVTFRRISDSGEPAVDVHGISGSLKKIKFVKE